MSDHITQVKAILDHALTIPSTVDRRAYLEFVCGQEGTLRQEVEVLLRAHGKAVDAQGVSGLAPAAPATLLDRSLAEGTQIGPYKLREMIGEGGFGVVYVAEQEKPVRRKVALKIIKPGMDTKDVIARFEAERQALALMDHPNVARVLDAGATDAGRPYFVMELVHGVPITEFCDKNNLETRRRLEMFVEVCHAILHAHQKGIIHRDLKPSNIMVTLHDGRPVPKVIDFGVAKALSHQLTEKTIYTYYGQMIGTPAYMSPEQAEMSGLGVDTRSDIYSLGVLLYELLTGRTPLDAERLQTSGYAGMLKLICEEEPPRPSLRVSTLGEQATVVAKHRHTDPGMLSRDLRGELDWIVMKALDKDRNRRYETAGDFAADVRRFLNGEAIEACPPSAAYRFRKFARRHRGLLAGAAAVAAVLVLGAAVSLWQAVRATRAEGRAREERDRAKASAAETLTVLRFLQDRVLAAARPEGQEGGLGKDVTLRKAIDQAERGIAAGFKDQPAAEASVRQVLGETYSYLGEFAAAVQQQERALALRKAHLGANHPDTLTSMFYLSTTYVGAGKYQQAQELSEECLTLSKAVLGPDHLTTLRSMGSLGIAYMCLGKNDQALPILEEAFQRQKAKVGLDDREVLLIRSYLSQAYAWIGKWEQATQLADEYLQLMKSKRGPDHPDTLSAITALAAVYLENNRADVALAMLDDTLRLARSKLGPHHIQTLYIMFALAWGHWNSGKWEECALLVGEAARMSREKYGPEHPDTIWFLQELASMHLEFGRLEQAEKGLSDCLEIARQTLGEKNPLTLRVMLIQARLPIARGGFARGAQENARVMELSRAALGEDNPITLLAWNNMAYARARNGELALAERLFVDLLPKLSRVFGPEHAGKLQTMANLGEVYQRQGKLAEAETILRENLAMREKRQPKSFFLASTQSPLGRVLAGQKKHEEAEKLLLAGYEGLKANAGCTPASWGKHYLPDTVLWLAELYEAWGKPEPAAKWRKELEAVRPAKN